MDEAKSMGYKFVDTREILGGNKSTYIGNSGLPLEIRVLGDNNYQLTVRNFDPEKARREEKKKEEILNKTNGLILHASDYLNGENPSINTLSINDFLKIFNGKALNSAKAYLNSKGYKYIRFDIDHYWDKSSNNLSNRSSIEAEFKNGTLFEMDMTFYNDKTCAALVAQLEKMGYKRKYKNPVINYQYYFTKEGSNHVFGVCGKQVFNSKVPAGTIEYTVAVFSSSAFNAMRSYGRVIEVK